MGVEINQSFLKPVSLGCYIGAQFNRAHHKFLHGFNWRESAAKYPNQNKKRRKPWNKTQEKEKRKIKRGKGREREAEKGRQRKKSREKEAEKRRQRKGGREMEGEKEKKKRARTNRANGGLCYMPGENDVGWADEVDRWDICGIDSGRYGPRACYHSNDPTESSQQKQPELPKSHTDFIPTLQPYPAHIDGNQSMIHLAPQQSDLPDSGLDGLEWFV